MAAIDYLDNYGLKIYPIGFIFIAIFLSIVTYAIVKHRLMDIELVIKRSTYFLFLFLIIVFPTTYLVNLATAHIAMGSIRMFFVASVWSGIFIFIDQIKRLLERLTDRIFFMADYNYDDVLAAMTNQLQHISDIPTLVKNFDREFKEVLKVENTGVFILSHGRTRFHQLNVDNMDQVYERQPSRELVKAIMPIRKNSPIVQMIKEKPKNCILYSEVREEFERTRSPQVQQLLQYMDQINSRMMIGSVANDEVTGMITIGAKKSGNDFKDKDINLLHNLVNQGALVVAKIFEIEEKAKLHAEKELEEKHRREVEEMNNQLNDTLIELKKTQEKLIEEEQTSAIGKIAGEVAHDMRNPLSSINRYISSLESKGCIKNSKYALADVYKHIETQSDMPDQEQLMAYIKFVLANIQELEDSLLEIQDINTALRKIANDFLDYSKVSRDIPTELISIQTIVSEQLDKAANDCAENFIEVRTTMDSEKKVCLFDHQVRKIFDNLFDNAQKAILECQKCGKRVITVKLFNTEHPDRVVLEVGDTGGGIPEDALHSIFKPFYSRRKNLQGTGLGLAIIKKIVDNYKGDIEVRSEVGAGAVFRVSLPCFD